MTANEADFTTCRNKDESTSVILGNGKDVIWVLASRIPDHG